MVDTVRATQVYAEIIYTASSDAKARATQAYAEIILTASSDAKARATQAYAEIIFEAWGRLGGTVSDEAAGSADLSAVVPTTLGGTLSDDKAAGSAELFVGGSPATPDAILAQLGIEVLSSPVGEARLAQLSVEALLLNPSPGIQLSATLADDAGGAVTLKCGATLAATTLTDEAAATAANLFVVAAVDLGATGLDDAIGAASFLVTGEVLLGGPLADEALLTAALNTASEDPNNVIAVLLS